MTRSIAVFTVSVLAFAGACKKKDESPKAAPTKAVAAPAPAEPAPTPPPATKPAPPPSPPAVAIDPATFVPVDVSGIAALAKVAVKGPPGATITADEPPVGEPAPAGVTIAAGDFVLHVYRGTLGGERTGLPIKAQMANGTYAETVSTPKLVEYTIDVAGAKSYGFVQVAITPVDGSDQVLCGPAKELASADGFAPYRAACAAVTKAK